jgi:hypothetical protein
MNEGPIRRIIHVDMDAFYFSSSPRRASEGRGFGVQATAMRGKPVHGPFFDPAVLAAGGNSHVAGAPGGGFIVWFEGWRS